jgi:hypothetical protein
MPDQPLHSPSAAAKLISRPPHGHTVNVHTLRRWCALHAVHLSPGANPNLGKDNDAPDTARWLTDRDVEVLRMVAQLRAEGASTDAINDKLATVVFAVVTHEDDNVANPDHDRVVNVITTTPPSPQEAQELTQLSPVILSGINERFAALERQRRDPIDMLVTGIVIGVAVTLIVVAIVLGME